MYTAAAHEIIAISLFPVTAVVIAWSSGTSLDVGWDFFSWGHAGERGAR